MYENHFRGRLIYGITAQMREINEDISHKDLFIKNRTRTVLKLLQFWFDFL